MSQQCPDQLGSPISDRPKPGKLFAEVGFAILFAFLAAVSLFIVFHPFFASNYDAILADPGDGRYELTILEHWTRALHGQVPIASPNFFYPEKRVLGNSDTLLGLGVPYAALRSMGVDRYLALELVMMLMTVLGLFGMYRLLLEVLHFRRSTALFGAFLFIISNMYYIDVVHMHLNFVVVAPWLFVFAARFWRARTTRPLAARLWINAFSVLLAVFFYTTYYEAWFFVFCGASGVAFYPVVAYFVGGKQTVSRMFREVRAQTWNLLLGLFVFMLAMVPFFALYLPSLHRTGQRTLSETLYFMPAPLGMLDVGRDSLVWGRMSARIQDLTSPGGIHEHPTGWPLFTILVFVAVSIYCGVSLWRSRHANTGVENWLLCMMSAIALTCLTLWTAGVRIGDQAPVWAVLWRVAPGAAALRVPQRINLVLNIGVVIVCMFGLETLRRRLGPRGGAVGYLVVLLAGALIVEQINFMPTHLISRRAEAEEFAKVSPPPTECTEFYVSNWSDQPAAMLARQTDGMLIAEEYGIPTLNGYSSWFPQGWNLIGAADGHVTEEAVAWSKQHGLNSGLCALDMIWGTWTPVDIGNYVATGSSNRALTGEAANPGFEESELNSWAPFQSVNAIVAGAEAHSGRHSLAETDGAGSAYQDISGLQPGLRYRISAFVAASPEANAAAQIAAYDTGTSVASYSDTVRPGTGWQQLSHSITLGNNTTMIRVHLFRTEGKGTVYWDDIRIDPENGSDNAATKTASSKIAGK